MTNPSPPTPPPDAPPATPSMPWYRHERWAIGGGAVAVLMVIAAFGSWLFPHSPEAPQVTQSPQAAQSPSVTAATPAADPVIATVTKTGGMSPTCGAKGYLLVKGLAQIKGDPPPPSAPLFEGLADWLPRHGGVEVITYMQMTVESPQSRAVILTGVRAVLDSRSPVVGAVAEIASCGGGMVERYFAVDLAQTTPTVASLPGTGGMGASPTPAVSFPFKVSDVDPEAFTFMLKQPPGDVTWHLELSWTLDGVTGLSRVPQGKGEFRSTSAPFYSAGRPEDLLGPVQPLHGVWLP